MKGAILAGILAVFGAMLLKIIVVVANFSGNDLTVANLVSLVMLIGGVISILNSAFKGSK